MSYLHNSTSLQGNYLFPPQPEVWALLLEGHMPQNNSAPTEGAKQNNSAPFLLMYTKKITWMLCEVYN